MENMKKQITRISILQSSKVATALYALMGFIYILMPIPMAVLGFIFFVLFAAIYNLLARWLGGMEVEVTDISRET
ncbi:MAG TPA: hypothetical protein VNH83_18560 [Bryobacteraceae bacterium]|nr:hypothetical protein [Bryobacteraceae bacterium]